MHKKGPRREKIENLKKRRGGRRAWDGGYANAAAGGEGNGCRKSKLVRQDMNARKKQEAA